MTEKKKEPVVESPERAKVVEDSQSPLNEAQQQPSGSGDRRTSNAVGVPLPWGTQTDDLHPVMQPQGDVTDPENDERTVAKEQTKRSA